MRGNRSLYSNVAFRAMALLFRLRDLIHPPVRTLEDAGIKPGMTVLDFGCGPGAFSIAAAQLAGPDGKVYALDIHPLAVRSVQRAAARRGIGNIKPIRGDSLSEIPAESIDTVLLYDLLHEVENPIPTLAAIHRVLKPKGVLSVTDHHLKEDVLGTVTGTGRFRLVRRGRRTVTFERADTPTAVETGEQR